MVELNEATDFVVAARGSNNSDQRTLKKPCISPVLLSIALFVPCVEEMPAQGTYSVAELGLLLQRRPTNDEGTLFKNLMGARVSFSPRIFSNYSKCKKQRREPRERAERVDLRY